MKHQLAYQPAPVDCVIFWGLIVAGLGLTAVVQLELLGLSPITLAIGAVTVICALAQLWRYRISVTAHTIRLGRVLPGNSIILDTNQVTIQVQGPHTLIFNTQRYGVLTISTWRRSSVVASQLQAWLTTTK
ncbi:hypothetical protein [Lacticaseibacillus thailandensis]|uniref:hypothetical protein n=1 Tax=Lacticaseibacillus thailandensis TaxID=381741 RepID=UPI0007055705|nr:hypothetical protein [Lacticaseibacillus thailandensis]